MRIAMLLLALAAPACTPRAVSLPPGHPARADAPVGRLAGPPASLPPGVAADALVPPPPPAPGTGARGHGAHGSHEHDRPAPTDAPTGHEGHEQDTP
jgi:hypothetical protein